MPRLTINDYRDQYKAIANKEAAKRWNIATIKKKIALAQAEIDFEKNAEKKENKNISVGSKPEFEKMLDSQEDNVVIDPEEKTENRGGFREGAGRPVGQTDERAKCERLMSLEKPDLAVSKIFQGLNLALGKATGVPFTFDEVESIALGVTLPLYYWFPSMEGRAGVFTLHCTALENIGVPFVARTIRLKEYQNKKESELENDETKTEDPGTKTGNETSGNDTNKIRKVVKRSTAAKKSKTGIKRKT